jgi:adenylate cyclase
MKEIERKFLVDKYKLMSDIRSINIIDKYQIEQGYLCKDDGITVRIRIQNIIGFITIKGKTKNISRDEYEFEIPLKDANDLLKMCDKTIIKERTVIEHFDKHWYVDIFDGENKGLVVAEIELKDENEEFSLPSWLLKEVSHDSRYYNSNLISDPFNNWV